MRRGQLRFALRTSSEREEELLVRIRELEGLGSPEKLDEYRRGRLEAIYQAFGPPGEDLELVQVGHAELFAMGQARRRAEGRTIEWTDAMTNRMRIAMGGDESGQVPMSGFVSYFDKKLPADLLSFNAAVKQLFDVARQCNESRRGPSPGSYERELEILRSRLEAGVAVELSRLQESYHALSMPELRELLGVAEVEVHEHDDEMLRMEVHEQNLVYDLDGDGVVDEHEMSHAVKAREMLGHHALPPTGDVMHAANKSALMVPLLANKRILLMEEAHIKLLEAELDLKQRFKAAAQAREAGNDSDHMAIAESDDSEDEDLHLVASELRRQLTAAQERLAEIEGRETELLRKIMMLKRDLKLAGKALEEGSSGSELWEALTSNEAIKAAQAQLRGHEATVAAQAHRILELESVLMRVEEQGADAAMEALLKRKPAAADVPASVGDRARQESNLDTLARTLRHMQRSHLFQAWMTWLVGVEVRRQQQHHLEVVFRHWLGKQLLISDTNSLSLTLTPYLLLEVVLRHWLGKQLARSFNQWKAEAGVMSHLHGKLDGKLQQPPGRGRSQTSPNLDLLAASSGLSEGSLWSEAQLVAAEQAPVKPGARMRIVNVPEYHAGFRGELVRIDALHEDGEHWVAHRDEDHEIPPEYYAFQTWQLAYPPLEETRSPSGSVWHDGEELPEPPIPVRRGVKSLEDLEDLNESLEESSGRRPYFRLPKHLKEQMADPALTTHLNTLVVTHDHFGKDSHTSKRHANVDTKRRAAAGGFLHTLTSVDGGGKSSSALGRPQVEAGPASAEAWLPWDAPHASAQTETSPQESETPTSASPLTWPVYQSSMPPRGVSQATDTSPGSPQSTASSPTSSRRRRSPSGVPARPGGLPYGIGSP